MKIVNSKLHNSNIVKLKYFIKLCFFSLLLTLFMTVSAHAHDAECGVWGGEQDALILGTIERINNYECQVSVAEALPCPKGASFYKMIPLNKVPSSIIVDTSNFNSYSMSFNEKKHFNIGDYVILAIDKAQKNWTLTYPPCEVSSLDSKTLEFLPEEKRTSMSVAWEEFVHTKGKMHDFFFSGSDLLIKDTDKDGNKILKKIFPANTNYYEDIEEEDNLKVIGGTRLSSWVKDSSSLLDYAWTIPILLLIFLALIIVVRNSSKQ